MLIMENVFRSKEILWGISTSIDDENLNRTDVLYSTFMASIY